MSIRRGYISRTDSFTLVPNDWVRDVRLSRRARGLLAELMSHAPGWETSVEALVASGPEGRDAIRGALAELETCGYLKRVQGRGEGGRLAGSDYLITDPADSPSSDNPTTGEPTTGEPTSAEQPHKKNNSQKTISKNSSTAPPSALADEHFDAFWAAYPRKVGKDAARKAFRSAVKRSSVAAVMAGLERFVFSEETQYQPHPATWLNAGRFADETTPQAPKRAKLQPWEM